MKCVFALLDLNQNWKVFVSEALKSKRSKGEDLRNHWGIGYPTSDLNWS